MLNASQKYFLQDLFPGGQCILNPEEALAYGCDHSRTDALPWAVVRPQSIRQCAEFMAWADSERVPVVPRGRGTGVAGGAVPLSGGVAVSMLDLNRIIDISADDFVAVVQAGVVNGDLQAKLAGQQLFYPPDPASVNISTVGGNIATCAGGMRAVKYGVTRDYVLGVTAVMPGGTVLKTGSRTHKNVAGLDLTRLFVGSEGTLGIVAEAILKLLPLPEASASLLAGFTDFPTALEAARNVFQAGFLPTAMEFLDQGVLTAITEVAPGAPWDERTGAAFLFRLDGSRDGLAVEVTKLESILSLSSPVFMEAGRTPQEEETLWALRRMVSPALFKMSPGRLSEDVAVPRGRIMEAANAFRAAGQKRGIEVVNFGHLGDGNIHVEVLYNQRSEEAQSAAYEVIDDVVRITLDMGGSISGEHGVGFVKLKYLQRMMTPEERLYTQGIKQVFDPHNIMNPGKALAL